MVGPKVSGLSVSDAGVLYPEDVLDKVEGAGVFPDEVWKCILEEGTMNENCGMS